MPQLERLHKIVGHLKTLTKAGLPTLLTAFQRGEYTTIPGTVVFFATPGAFVIRLPWILLAFVSMDPEVLWLVSLPLVGR